MEVPRVVLGCGTFGGVGSLPSLVGLGETEEAAFRLMDAAWESGIRWFDTADAYAGGLSEEWIGNWIRETGNRPALTTKTFNPMGPGADSGLSRDRILRQIDSSLERLGVDHVDVYLAHEFDPDTPLEATFDTLEELVAGGAIRSYGVSNFDGAQLAAAIAAGRPEIVQNSYSLLDRKDDLEVLPLCSAHGIFYQAYSPLAGGWLTGKYRRDQPRPSNSRLALVPEWYVHIDEERAFRGLEGLAATAEARGSGIVAFALGWLLSHPLVGGIVVGPRRPEQLEPVGQALTLRLSAQERDELTSLFELRPAPARG